MIRYLSIALIVSSFSLIFGRSESKAVDCSPELSGVLTILVQAQSAFDNGDAEIGLNFVKVARLALETIEQGCDSTTSFGQTDNNTSSADTSRTNPKPLNEEAQVFGGRLVVNKVNFVDEVLLGLIPETVHKGEKWVTVSVTYFCDVSPDLKCGGYNLQSSLISLSGEIYPELNLFSDSKYFSFGLGDVIYGGGQIEGELLFSVPVTEQDLILSVEERGTLLHSPTTSPTFFALS